jgi:hypothetical protein
MAESESRGNRSLHKIRGGTITASIFADQNDNAGIRAAFHRSGCPPMTAFRTRNFTGIITEIELRQIDPAVRSLRYQLSALFPAAQAR